MKNSLILHGLVSLYLGLWCGGVLSYRVLGEHLSIMMAGISLSLLFLTLGIVCILNFKYSARGISVAVVLNIVFVILALFISSPMMVVFTGVLQGIQAGFIVKSRVNNGDSKKTALALFLGFMTSFAIIKLPVSLERVTPNGWGTNSFLVIIVIILTLALMAVFSLRWKGFQWESDKRNAVVYDNNKKVMNLLAWGVLSLIVVVEVSFYLWSVIMTHSDLSLNLQLKMPMAVVSAVLFRMLYLKKGDTKPDKGWLFVATILFMLSIGYFYSFKTIWIFVAIFGWSIAAIHRHLPRISTFLNPYMQVGFIIFFMALITLISGFFMENHIEFVMALKMPHSLVHLSALQAWTKVLADLAGVAVVLSGIIYLKEVLFKKVT